MLNRKRKKELYRLLRNTILQNKDKIKENIQLEPNIVQVLLQIILKDNDIVKYLDFKGIIFNGMDVRYVDFTGAINVDLDPQTIKYKSLYQTNVSGIDFMDKDCTGVDFRQADLSGVNGIILNLYEYM